MNQPASTIGVLVFQGDSILMIRHGANSAYLKEVYGFPAGHIEECETEPQTAVRELFEETGLVSSEDDLIELPTVYYSQIERKEGLKSFRFKVYLCQKYSGDITHSHEGEAVWVPVDKLAKLPTLPDVLNVIQEGLEARR